MTDFQNTPAFLSHHTLQRAGCPLHYWTGGAAGRPWLVFMHGAMATTTAPAPSAATCRCGRSRSRTRSIR